MTTLDEAREWHLATRRQLHLMRRLARNYWSDLLPILDSDSHFRHIAGPEVVLTETERSLGELDDLAVVVLFSVFEVHVRDAVLRQLQALDSPPDHPVRGRALEDAEQWIREGSFYRILDSYKKRVDHDLIEQVNQVRKFRNWIAHGKRGEKPESVDPPDAYDRLKLFLSTLNLT